MHSYMYKAKNREGTLIAGNMRARGRESVVNALKEKGYYLLAVEPESMVTSLLRIDAGFLNRVNTRDKAIFTHQLATMLRAGVRLSIALKTLSKQTRSRYLTWVIHQVHTDVEQSSSLSQAMARHPRVFTPVYRAVVAAAEESGSLTETLSILSRQLKAKASVNARIRGAMVYPIFLLVVSAVVVMVLTTFVIPKFIELFINTNQALPLPTRILVGATDFVKGSWWLLATAVCGFFVLLFVALKDAQFRFAFDNMLLRLPVTGSLNRKLQLARFTRTLGSLLNGGVRIVTAIKTTRGTTTNRAFAREIADIEGAILKGSTLAGAVGEQMYFDDIAANMIAVGEQTGMLPEMLLEVADMYDQDCESAIGSITNLLGPVLIVILGIIIGFVVMAILLPIFETGTIVG